MKICNKIVPIIAMCFQLFTLINSAISQDDTYTKDLKNRLRPGDEINLKVIGYEDFEGTYLITSDGNIELPLIGVSKAENLTLDELIDSLMYYDEISGEYDEEELISEINKIKSHPHNRMDFGGGFQRISVYKRRKKYAKGGSVKPSSYFKEGLSFLNW